VVDELTRDEVNSKVNDVVLSPPLCIAVQIGLVRLLASWNIRPTAITSHSSGEVAAAYAAGLIDLREAMAIVFTRGAFLQSMQENVHYHGAMIAVGMGRDAAESFMEQMGTTGKTVVACVNSPSSVTISGDQSAIAILERQLQQDKVFVRALNVPVAYHSHHMNSVAGDYLAVLQGSLRKERNFKKVHYTSPVTGYPVIDPSTIGAEHWVKNMVQPVLFVDSLSTMCVSPDGQQLVDSVIEVGAHGALSGPIRQTLKLSHLKDLPITYSSCLWRGKDAVATMQDLAGSLITQGYPVDLKAVNFPTQVATLRALGDLPSYPWNHRTRYWHEPRINRAHRNKQLPTHDLLGVRLLGSNPKTPTWKHFIRPSELPWVMDHQVQSDIIYPAAGMLCMAMEAMRQVGFAEGRSFTSLKFRNIDFLRALIVPNTERGIEVQVVLLDGDDKTLGLTGWKTFTITSVQNDGTWGEHCGGLIGFETKRRGASDVSFTLDHDPSMTSEDAQSIFSHLRSLGIFHGESFRNVYSSKMTGPRKSIASIVVPDSATLMPLGYQHDHLIHPTTLDSIIVAAYTSLPAHGTLLKSGMVPRYIKSMSVSCSVNRSPGDVLQAQATLLDTDDQGFHASLSVRGSSSAEAVIVIDDLHCISIGTPTSQEENPRNRCLQIEWVEDFAFVPTATWFDRLRAMPDPEESAIAQELDQACFYYFYQTVALLTQSDVQNLLWYHRLYYNWMEAQIVQHRMAVDWLKVNASDRQSLLSHVAKRSTSGAMVCRVGENLAQILRQQITPLELMVEDQLLYRYYQEALHIGSSYRQVYQIIDLFAHKNPKARILEIGAGTGGCTSHVIRALGGGDTNREARFSRYDFTDVSVSFFDEAKNRFSVWGDLIDYRKLDVEKDPVSQGYEEGHYDLVVACQVLHATTNMDSTMTNVRRLLKPGGKLVLVETTQDSHDIQLIFGVLPDWWLSKSQECPMQDTNIQLNLGR
jgi:acyl transferase domain-containing protein/ubiquinone/menaquinone biosynthesis C-methylase UbiE